MKIRTDTNLNARIGKLLLAGVGAAALLAVSQFTGISANGGDLFGAAYAQGNGHGKSGAGSGQSAGGQGGGGQQFKGGRDSGGTAGPTVPRATEEEDSDRPDWAGQGGGGNPQPGTGDPDSDRPAWAGRGATKPGGGQPTTDLGSLYGDLYVIVRNDNGEPVLYVWEDRDGDGTPEPYPSADGYPQPIAADGALIPLDDEGHPIDESLVQEVELSRLNIARSPDKVTERALDEAIATLNSATEVQTDAAGRLMVLIDGEWKTIDSPVENMALYLDLIADGTIAGLTNPTVTSAFPNLTDGKLDSADLLVGAVLLAATADKFTALSLDAVMYVNNILGVNDPATSTYIDLTSVSYDRSDVYGDVTAEVLVDPENDGTWTVATVNIFDAVFGSTDVTATAAAGFAQAVDDARAVVNFIHEYEVPATASTTTIAN
jgi:hypothetical protein